MYRLFCGASVLALIALTAPAADEGVELKSYKPKVGDRVRVTDEERTTTRTATLIGEKREDKLEKRVKVVHFTSETLAVKDGEKKPTKIKRIYDKAEETKDDESNKLPLHAKTVIIEKKADKYTFTYDDGKSVDGKPREELEKEFNKKDEDDIEDFIPKRALKPGETWKMDTDKLVKALTKEKDPFVVDKKAVTGTGKFVEGYSFGGKPYGVYNLRMEFPLTELTGQNNVALKKGSKMVMDILGDGNTDGSEPDGIVSVRLTLRVFFDGPNGIDASIKSDGIMTRATERLPRRPRD